MDEHGMKYKGKGEVRLQAKSLLCLELVGYARHGNQSIKWKSDFNLLQGLDY